MRSIEVKTGVVLLAAGQGKRFGGAKLTADFRGRPLWQWAAETAEKIDFSKRVLVVHENSSIGKRRGWRRIENTQADQGMGTSIAAGVRTMTDCNRVVIMLADMPLVSHTHIGRLVATQGVAFTLYPDETAGCPASFPRSAFPLLESLNGDKGAQNLDLGDAALLAPSHERQLADVDERCDLQRLEAAD